MYVCMYVCIMYVCMYVYIKALPPVCLKYTAQDESSSTSSLQELYILMHANEVAVSQVFYCIFVLTGYSI